MARLPREKVNAGGWLPAILKLSTTDAACDACPYAHMRQGLLTTCLMMRTGVILPPRYCSMASGKNSVATTTTTPWLIHEETTKSHCLTSRHDTRWSVRRRQPPRYKPFTMISAVAWIPRGAAQAIPTLADLSPEELKALQAQAEPPQAPQVIVYANDERVEV